MSTTDDDPMREFARALFRRDPSAGDDRPEPVAPSLEDDDMREFARQMFNTTHRSTTPKENS